MASLDLRKDGLLGLLSKLNLLYKIVHDNNLELTAGFHLLRVASCASKHESAMREIVILIKLLRDNGMAVPSGLFVQMPPTTIANLPNEILDAVFADLLRAEGWTPASLLPSGDNTRFRHDENTIKTLVKSINRFSQNKQLRSVAIESTSSFFTFSQTHVFQLRDQSIPSTVRQNVLSNIKRLQLSVTYGYGPFFKVYKFHPVCDRTWSDSLRFSGTMIQVTKHEFRRVKSALPRLVSATIEFDIAPMTEEEREQKTSKLLCNLRGLDVQDCKVRGGQWLDPTDVKHMKKAQLMGHGETVAAVLAGEKWIDVDGTDFWLGLQQTEPAKELLETTIVPDLRCGRGLLQTWNKWLECWDDDMMHEVFRWEYGLDAL